MIPVLVCVACNALLSADERAYYGNTCDKCEQEWNSRTEAWRRGAHDPELDQAFRTGT